MKSFENVFQSFSYVSLSSQQYCTVLTSSLQEASNIHVFDLHKLVEENFSLQFLTYFLKSRSIFQYDMQDRLSLVDALCVQSKFQRLFW